MLVHLRDRRPSDWVYCATVMVEQLGYLLEYGEFNSPYPTNVFMEARQFFELALQYCSPFESDRPINQVARQFDIATQVMIGAFSGIAAGQEITYRLAYYLWLVGEFQEGKQPKGPKPVMLVEMRHFFLHLKTLGESEATPF